MTIKPWWDEWPGLLDIELDALTAANIRHELDVQYRDTHGVVKVLVWPVVDGVERRLEAVYPDLYPWFRPEVLSLVDDFPKHQGPFAKNLCLLPRETDAWHPGFDTLAGILQSQLPKVYASMTAPDARELEVHQAEPFTEYYDRDGVGALIVDSTWDLGDAHHGTFEYGLFRHRLLFGEHAQETVFVGAVLTVRDERGDTIATAAGALAKRFDNRCEGRWQRRGDPLRQEGATAARQAVRKEHKYLAKTEYERVGGLNASEAEVVGIVFPIEADYAGATADAWMFLVSFAPPMSRSDKRGLDSRALHPHGHTHWLAGQRGGLADLEVRIPQLGPLRGKNVLLIGAGALGAPAAQQLAQSGANVRVVDGDVVEAATAVRFPLGHADAGRAKVVALGQQLVAHSPFSEIDCTGTRLGAARLDGTGPDQHEVVNTLLDGVDLIFDATASHAVGLFLGDCAAVLNLPFINVTTTSGCWGGRVMALWPHEGACFDCVYRHVDERNDDSIPVEERLIPPEQPGGEIRPLGCGDATYTGTSFDALAVVAVAVRAAASLLCNGAEGAYPPINWNLAIIWNRTHDGEPLAGRTFEFDLERHGKCDECKRRSG